MIAKYDIAKKVWEVTDVPTEPLLEKDIKIPVFIGFTNSGNLETEFDDLSFGIDISDDGAPDKSILSLPPLGTTIVSSDQEFEYMGYITDLTVGVSSIKFWAKNSGVRKEKSVDVIVKSAVYILIESNTGLGDEQVSISVITPPDPDNAEGIVPPVDLP